MTDPANIDFADFDRYCLEHDITEAELPAALGAWLHERTGWDGDIALVESGIGPRNPYPVGSVVHVRDYDDTTLGPYTVVRSYWPQPVCELIDPNNTDRGMIRQNHDRMTLERRSNP